MSKELPKQPSLEHLRNEAKALLRQARAGQAKLEELKLASAQLAVARSYGFSNWAKLKRAVEGYASDLEELFSSIKSGDREQAAAVLDRNRGLIHTRDPNNFGAPALNIAASRNDRPMLELLLERGADPNARSDWWAGGFCALDFCDKDTADWLLQRGARLTAHAASRLGKFDELKRMISDRPELVHERGGDGQLPLHFAKSPEIVDVLLDAGADIEARDIDHEGTAAQHRILDEDVFLRLISRGARKDIFMAVVLGDLELVKQFLDDDPEATRRATCEPGNPLIPQAPGGHIYTYNLGFVVPFQVAVRFERWEIYEELFNRCPPHHQLVMECWRGDLDSVSRFVRNHPQALAKLGDHERQLLPMAAKFPRTEAVKAMLEVGWDVNIADAEGMSAIHWASFQGNAPLVELILAYKPDLELRNRYGGTVLGTGIYGSVHGWPKGGDYARCAELLIQAGSRLPDKVEGSSAVQEVLHKHLRETGAFS